MTKSDKKSIAVKIYFWSVEEKKDTIKKGVAWASGTIALESNTAHGIKADTKVFNSLEEMQVKLHELLKDNEVSLVMGDNANIPRLGKAILLKADLGRSEHARLPVHNKIKSILNHASL